MGYLFYALLAVPFAYIRHKKRNQNFFGAWFYCTIIVVLIFWAIGAISLALYDPSGWRFFWAIALVVLIFLALRRDQKEFRKFGPVLSKQIERSSGVTKKNIRTIRPGDTLNFPVKGVTFERRQEIIPNIKGGDLVMLAFETDNPHDPYAIKVVWEDQLVGYVPAEIAKGIYRAGLTPGLLQYWYGFVTEIHLPSTHPPGLKIKTYLPTQKYIDETFERRGYSKDLNPNTSYLRKLNASTTTDISRKPSS